MPAVEAHVDAVVVGSGFGGSVSAYRLAEAGRSVLVLERGKPYPPGSFARRPREMGRNIWDPSRGYHGLFDVWTFRGLEAVVSSGLGGGSLIYANVLLRKDERWFVHEHPVHGGVENWPVSRADLDPHYDRVEKMMRPQHFPLGAPNYPTPSKTVGMRDAAGALGLDWKLLPLAVTFANEGRAPALAEPIPEYEYPNIHGLPRRTCRLCGECDVGCNEGSKNTLDHTYLSAAKHQGAEIRTQCEVHSIERRPEGGYVVGYVQYGAEHEGVKVNTDKLPLVKVSCDHLVLAAGTLATPHLLLRNRSALPELGPALGTRFCGNGDLLMFILDAHQRAGGGGPRRPLDPSLGPVITGAVRVPDSADGGDGPGYYIEDAGFPIAVDWMLETLTVPSRANRILQSVAARVISRIRKHPRSSLSTELQALIGEATLSSTSLPLLGMGRDIPDGVMRIKRGQLDIDWTTATSKAYFERVRHTMKALGAELGGEVQDNPLWWLKRVITVHPLGGCPMGRNRDEGVVDQWGEAFDYPGLHVVDGSVMPGPVGANPSLTIAAFADRAMDHLLESPARRTTARPARHVDPVPPPPPEGPHTNGDETAVSFTEEMKGFVTFGSTDYETAYESGKLEGTAFMFHLTITCPDVERFLHDRDHHGTAVGWVKCDQLGGKLEVERGDFNLFVADAGPRRRHMYYRLYFTDSTGHPLTMAGYKDVDDDHGFDVWSDTSTLYIRLLSGHVPVEQDADAEIVASGILHILVPDFARQLTTFRATGPSMEARAKALGAFGKSFLADLWDVFGPPARK
ncbi:MAG TPA: GMC family oxidoreductase [Acidimicrobiales bacterium]|nr:GMC family oxidoreductase [Acidimicrobiales bacterium]